MNFLQAEKIIQKYGGSITNLKIQNGNIVRRKSWLKNSREEIIKAFKIYIAHGVIFRTLSEESFNSCIVTLDLIDSFIPDDEAEYIDELYKKRLNNEKLSPKENELINTYVNLFISQEVHDDMCYFIEKVEKLKIDSELLCQNIYTLVNVEYTPEYKKYFNPTFVNNANIYGLDYAELEYNKATTKSKSKKSIFSILGYGNDSCKKPR